MTTRPTRAGVTVELPAEPPPVSPAVARLLAAIVHDAASDPSLVEWRIGPSPGEPEAVAS